MALRVLFLDMNAYFASVEQQMRPELRHQPVAVVPMLTTDRTCCIAVSYEARPYGIKTGTGVDEAKRLCADLVLVEARAELYVEVHHRIIAAVDTCVPVTEIHSIDEMSCRLLANERPPDRAVAIARKIKQVLRETVGEHLSCSIGLAPNRMLAKLAADMQKPDGLVVLPSEDLPERLYGLDITDFPGIGKRMQRRLARHGVGTVRELCGLSESQMVAIWESVVGNRWWHWLRGDDVIEPATRRRMFGHSRVLPPALRTEAGARAVLVHLIHKASTRLRRLGYWAGRMDLSVSYALDPSRSDRTWSAWARLGLCQDTFTMLETFAGLWEQRPRGKPMVVGVTLSKLTANAAATLPLFPGEQKRLCVVRAVDAVNARFGPLTVYFGGMHTVRDAVPTRIAFTSIPEIEVRGEK